VIRRVTVRADEILTAFVELERQVLTLTFYLESIHAGECDSLRYGTWGSRSFRTAACGGRS